MKKLLVSLAVVSLFACGTRGSLYTSQLIVSSCSADAHDRRQPACGAAHGRYFPAEPEDLT